ncbi:MAG: YebC/PmpR family DNA-binding transcriptional regulator [Chloroflexi bacterium]|nr:YebC/PmpR family DNA-binding transcriptional regulator [Chloroflexota bacterium]
MSGHSKWSTIKHGKAVTDAKRGQLFTKLAKEIIVAAKVGGGDPEMNFRLRIAVQRAKDSNMPAANIDRAIKKGTGSSNDSDQMIECTYEGYGPGGVGILLNALTDNKNRTVSDVRSTFTKMGGNLAQSGAVSWQFEQKGVVSIGGEKDILEEITLIAIDAGANDVENIGDTLNIYSDLSDTENIISSLKENNININSTVIDMIATNTVYLDEKAALQTLKLLDRLEELEDVQKVFSNADFSDDIFNKYGQ